jgi:CarD family transcriptional regulator
MRIGVNAMFNIGDIIFYSLHGLSKIDDICEKTFSDVTRTYYVIHPLEQPNLTISTPVDNDKVVMLKRMESEEAEEILQSFKQPGIDWIEDLKQRKMKYQDILATGKRKEIARVVNTLMRESFELSLNKKRLYDQDSKLLHKVQNLLFKELAMTLNTSFEEIVEQVNDMIRNSSQNPVKYQLN